MPSPFTSLPASTSKRPRRPEPVEPVPEAYVGDNNPYRGTQQHGIDSPTEPLPDLEYGEGRLVELPPEPQEVEPIPVRVVQESGRELRLMRTVSPYAGGTSKAQPRQLLGRDENRTSARIKNLNTATVTIGDTAESSRPGNGFPLDDNQEITTQTQGEVWGTIAQADDGPVAIIVEFSVRM